MGKVNKKVRCKICGYVMDESQLEAMKALAEAQAAEIKRAKEAGDTEKAKRIAAQAPVCPACGVSHKLFEPFEDPVEPDRRAFLHLDLHPVIVHAPQAITFINLLLLIAAFFVPGELRASLFITAQVLFVLLPVTLVASIVTGIMDAKVRFKKVTTPVLMQKIVLGTSFLVLSLVMAGLALWGNVSGNLLNYVIIIVLNITCLGLSAKLGLIGAKLIQAIFVKLAPAAKKTAGE